MIAHFDRLETRSPHSRETLLFRDLRAILSVGRARAASLRQQLKGVTIADIRTRADLTKIPMLRGDDLQALQCEQRPFGGLVAARASGLKRWIVTDDAMDVPEGKARDWWGAARALAAAGLTPNAVVLNCFSYTSAPQAYMIESGAEMLGAAVIPAGSDDAERVVGIIERLKPTFYCGSPEFLKRIVDKAEAGRRDISSIERGLVAGGVLTQGTRERLAERGIVVRQVFVNGQLGVVAYETEAADGSLNEGMVVSEHLLVEIVKPGADVAAAVGEVGEVVVTRVTSDYPLLRFAPGDFSAVVPGLSPCGRTNMRIKGSLGRMKVSGASRANTERPPATPVAAAAARGLTARIKALDAKVR